MPAPPETGIIFRRSDVGPVGDVAALSANVVSTSMSTVLACNGVRVATVEHLLAALMGSGIDNVYVVLDAPEVPILDGSAAPFVKLLREAGIQTQAARKRYVRVKREVVVEDGDKSARFSPFDGFKVSFTINFDHPAFREQASAYTFDFATMSFSHELCMARTFGFIRDVDSLRAAGMALGASFDNTLVLDSQELMNPEGYCCPDELVKHKVLDAIGDLALVGASLIGEFKAHKSGHTLNNAAVQALLAQPDAWEWVSFEGDQTAPITYENSVLR